MQVKQNLEDVAQRLVEELGPQTVAQMPKIFGLLANGKPVSLEELAHALGISSEETKDLLQEYGAEFDNEGRLVGLGLSLVPTPHKFQVNGRNLYAWCAEDTLLFPIILGQTALVESVDPISKEKIVLTISPQGVEEVQPKSTVLSMATNPDHHDVRGSLCNFTNWFASEETAQRYASQNAGVVVVKPEEIRAVLKMIEKKMRGKKAAISA